MSPRMSIDQAQSYAIFMAARALVATIDQRESYAEILRRLDTLQHLISDYRAMVQRQLETDEEKT